MEVKKFLEYTSQKQTFLKESISVSDYIKQVNTNEYLGLTKKLFNEIEEEGWLGDLEEHYDSGFSVKDFKYTKLELSDNDKKGLKNFDDDVVNKFNDFDIELKSKEAYPYKTIDMIDYDKGIVYIIKYISK